jgi:hypothetical protein
MSQECQVFYSPVLKCSHACFGNNKYCLRHLYDIRRTEDCSICLSELDVADADTILLQCGHLFHYKCIGNCKKPLCPLCRKQLTAEESVLVFNDTVIKPLMLRIYGLPAKSVEYVLNGTEMLLSIAAYGEQTISGLMNVIKQFHHAIFNTS